MNVEQLLATIRQNAGPHYFAGGATATWHTLGGPATDRSLAAIGLDFTLPPDLAELWRSASVVRLFEDLPDRQWGLELLPPECAVALTPKLRERLWRPSDCRDGDLAVGSLIGSLEYVIVRCDPGAADYGTVVVAVEIDTRDDWPVVGGNIVELMERYLQAQGDRFWPN